jgi:hypothetical protein
VFGCVEVSLEGGVPVAPVQRDVLAALETAGFKTTMTPADACPILLDTEKGVGQVGEVIAGVVIVGIAEPNPNAHRISYQVHLGISGFTTSSTFRKSGSANNSEKVRAALVPCIPLKRIPVGDT